MKRLVLALLFAALVVEGSYFVAHGRFNIDEGMHLYAGRLVYEQGRRPYRDFPFSQGPGGPYFYGAAGQVFGSSLLTGRCASLVLNLAGVAAMAWLAARVVGAAGAALVLLWTLVNLPALWAFTQIRTEPPSLALTSFATVAFFFRRGTALRWALSPALLVFATAFRLTYAIPLLAVSTVVAWELRRSPRTLAGAAAIVAACGLVAAWPLLAFPQESTFHILTGQLSRAERLGWADFPLSARFWFFGRPESGFWPILLLSGFPLFLLARRLRRGWRLREADVTDPTLVLVCSLAMALLTYAPLLLFRVGFFQYFINASLLLVLAIAIAVPIVARGSGGRGGLVWGAVALAWLGAAALGARHLETWVHRDEVTVTRLAGVRDRLRRLTPDGCTMLTFETHLAVEAHCDVVPGLEYSYFSFFREMPESEARAHGVLNRQLLARILRQDPPEYVALTGPGVERITGVAHQKGRPPMLRAMRGRYRHLMTLDLPVGPIHTFWNEVHVFARSDLEEAGGYSM